MVTLFSGVFFIGDKADHFPTQFVHRAEAHLIVRGDKAVYAGPIVEREAFHFFGGQLLLPKGFIWLADCLYPQTRGGS